jgi:ketosteroid isomerase-like protein
MSTKQNKQIMQHALDELANGNFAPFAACLADDIVWTIAGSTRWSGSYEGKPAVSRLLAAVQAQIDGPYRMTAHRLIAEDDIVVVEGRGNNLLRSGDRYDNTYCLVCRLDRGKLSAVTEYMDTALVARVFEHERPSKEAITLPT